QDFIVKRDVVTHDAKKFPGQPVSIHQNQQIGSAGRCGLRPSTVGHCGCPAETGRSKSQQCEHKKRGKEGASCKTRLHSEWLPDQKIFWGSRTATLLDAESCILSRLSGRGIQYLLEFTYADHTPAGS